MTLETVNLASFGIVIVRAQDAHAWRLGDITSAELYMLALG